MVLVDIKSMGIDLSPPKRSQKTFGWRTAALARERAIEKMSKAATPAAVKKNLSVDDRIAARKQRTIASLGPKVAAAVLRRQAAVVEPCTCCRRSKKKVRFAPEKSLAKVKRYEKYMVAGDPDNTIDVPAAVASRRRTRDEALGLIGDGWQSFGYSEHFPDDEDSESEDNNDSSEDDQDYNDDDETY